MRQVARIPRYEDGTGNLLLRGAWERWSTHRTALMILLEHAGRLAQNTHAVCCLGAGNCNDIDLCDLVRDFNEIALVDLDSSAIANGIEAQGLPADHESVLTIAPLEVTSHRFGPGSALQRSRYDVVLSSGLLTQLCQSELSRSDFVAPERLLAVRSQHLRFIADLLRPGGVGVLVVELVSTDTAPHLTRLEASALSNEMRRLIESGNFFTAMNPFAIWQCLSTDPTLGFAHAALTNPWLWRMTEARTYLTYALLLQRSE